ncbi:hypothetical protein OHA72_44170 [Dactylosporangium sp. NBC_01737]|uniref:MauE/DoxX family redox-associated membrane protein n=1 Tax=Dactylosporangium sp. NBC_01737 TaxID=2975959 RepID=UPI002E1619B1|nr:hypothetical protein OHA72_44170 [Dactylosporangium sp. NBC_01737]
MTAVAAGALAVVFAMAVAGKVSRPAFTRFRRSAAALWPVPGRLGARPATALAAAVLLAEAAVAAGLLLVGIVAPRPVFSAAVLLLAVFTAAQILALRRGRAVTCACFGRTDTSVSRTGVARNAVLIALGLLGAVTADRPGTTALSLVCAVAGGVAGLVVASLEDIVSLFRIPPVPAKGAGR